MRDPRLLAPGIRQCPVLRHKTQPGISGSSCGNKRALRGLRIAVLAAAEGTLPPLPGASQELRPPRRERCAESVHQFLLGMGQMGLRLLPGANAVTLSQGMPSV